MTTYGSNFREEEQKSFSSSHGSSAAVKPLLISKLFPTAVKRLYKNLIYNLDIPEEHQALVQQELSALDRDYIFSIVYKVLCILNKHKVFRGDIFIDDGSINEQYKQWKQNLWQLKLKDTIENYLMALGASGNNELNPSLHLVLLQNHMVS